MARNVLVVGILGVALWAAAAGADETEQAKEVFEKIFGKDLAVARATRDPKDDLALAEKMLAVARDSAGQPEFLALLCTSALDLAEDHRDGLAVAAEAVDLLARYVPEQAAALRERQAEVCQRRFDAAPAAEKPDVGEDLLDLLIPLAEDRIAAGGLQAAVGLYRRAAGAARTARSIRLAEIQDRAKWLAAACSAWDEAERLAVAGPDDRAKAVRLYLVQCDNPAAAAKCLDGVDDADLAKYVPASTKPVAEAPELACLELGEWYGRLAETAPPIAREPMFLRAEAYLERFLDLHGGKDLQRTRATLALEKVREAYDAATADRWVGILPRLSPKQHAVKGTWVRKGSAVAIVRGAAYGRAMIPAIVRGDYDMTVRFTRTAGTDCVGLLIPVGRTQTLVLLGSRSGAYHGMGPIGGVSPSANATTVRPGKLETGRPYEVGVRVRLDAGQAIVCIRLDNEPLIEWHGAESALGKVKPWGIPRSDCTGLVTYGVQAVFADAKVRTHSCRPAE